jgi:hypothetical protein
MPEDNHEEKKEHKAESPKHHFKLKMTKWDVLGIIILIIAVGLMVMPHYLPKDGCEIARPNNKCATIKDVMVENCAYWGNYSCNTASDVSLTQVEWYIDNLCKLQNQYHSEGLNCSRLKSACNQISASLVCPV